MSLCERVKDKFGEDFRFMTDLSGSSGREQGVNICERDENWELGQKRSGEEGSIVLLDCPPDTKAVGDFHSHDKDTTTPSSEDIRTSNNFICISNNDAEMRCIETNIPNSEKRAIAKELKNGWKTKEYQDCLGVFWRGQPLSSDIGQPLPGEVRWKLHDQCADPVINAVLSRHNLPQCTIQL